MQVMCTGTGVPGVTNGVSLGKKRVVGHEEPHGQPNFMRIVGAGS